MLNLTWQNSYKKDAKRYRHDQRARLAIETTISLLQTGQPLPPKYKEHTLIGNYAGYHECHCLPDVLLIYRKTDTDLVLFRIGSHAELF